MPIRPDSPLRRVTLNLYESDCAWLESHYGQGWTTRIRSHIHMEVLKRSNPKPVRTLGDLEE